MGEKLRAPIYNSLAIKFLPSLIPQHPLQVQAGKYIAQSIALRADCHGKIALAHNDDDDMTPNINNQIGALF